MCIAVTVADDFGSGFGDFGSASDSASLGLGDNPFTTPGKSVDAFGNAENPFGSGSGADEWGTW